MSDAPIDASWWLASDGKWYPPTSSSLPTSRSVSIGGNPPDLDAAKSHPPRRPEPPSLPAAASATAGVLRDLPATFRIVHGFGQGRRGYVVNHLVVGPTGVWVVIPVNEPGVLIKQGGTLWNGDRSISSRIEQVERLAAFAREVLGFETNPVLCFVQATLPRRAQMIGRVRVVELGALAEHVAAGSTTLSAADIEAADGRIDDWLRRAPTVPTRTAPATRPASLRRRAGIAAVVVAALAGGATIGVSTLTNVAVARTDSSAPTTTVAPTTLPAPPANVLTVDVTCPVRGRGYQLIPRSVSTGLDQLQVAATVDGHPQFIGPIASGQPGPPITGVGSATTVGFDFLVVETSGAAGPSSHLDFSTPPWPC